MKALGPLLARLREPSTMAGLSALAILVGAPAGVPEQLAQVVAAVAGVAAVLLPEARPEARPPQE